MTLLLIPTNDLRLTVTSINCDNFMLLKIEELKIGGKKMGLFNYKRANNIRGAAGRNKFKQETVRDVRFAGDGYLALDR